MNTLDLPLIYIYSSPVIRILLYAYLSTILATMVEFKALQQFGGGTETGPRLSREGIFLNGGGCEHQLHFSDSLHSFLANYRTEFPKINGDLIIHYSTASSFIASSGGE